MRSKKNRALVLLLVMFFALVPQIMTVLKMGSVSESAPCVPVVQRIASILLIRSIGNSLPPRHDPGQTIRSLEFILAHEEKFPNMERHWVLNRLVDQQLEARVVQILKDHGESFSILRFNLTYYSTLSYEFHFHMEGDEDAIHTEAFRDEWIPYRKCNTQDNIQHTKTLYVTNVNGARNFMLDIGKEKGVDWILPWDGNCFLTRNGFDPLHDTIQRFERQGSRTESTKYITVPMDRVTTNNSAVLSPTFKPNPIEEPQIAFHQTARGRFNPLLRYGRRNKVDLLVRLRVPGRLWSLNLIWEPWEYDAMGVQQQTVVDLPSNLKVSQAGFVMRLFSGNGELEKKDGFMKRGPSRTESVTRMLESLDRRVAVELYNFSADKLMFYDEATLKEEKKKFLGGDPSIGAIMASLLATANSSLKHGPWSVMNKPNSSCAPSLDCHDYFNPYSDYCSVGRNAAPYETRRRIDEGAISGVLRHDDEESYKFDQTRLTAMQSNVTVLSLAYYMTGNTTYAHHAANAIKVWFIDPETRMNPSLKYAQIRLKQKNNTDNGEGLYELKDVYFMLDAVRILQRDGFIPKDQQQLLKTWFQEYLEWLVNSVPGRKAYTARNYHGVYFDLQVAAVAAYVNELSKAMSYLDRSVSRMEVHFDTRGTQVLGLNQQMCESYDIISLQGWFTLARFGHSIGRNLWNKYPLQDNGEEISALCRTSLYTIPLFQDRLQCPENIKTMNQQRWWPLWYISQQACPSLQKLLPTSSNDWLQNEPQSPPSSHHGMPALFSACDDIAPFWNLGLP